MFYLSRHVCRPSCKDEGDKDPFPVLAANNVEPKPRRTLGQAHIARLPGKKDFVRVVMRMMNAKFKLCTMYMQFRLKHLCLYLISSSSEIERGTLYCGL